MKTLKAITLILAILIVAAPLGIFPIRAAPDPFYSVEPKATPPLTDLDPSIYNIETPTSDVVGEEFTVEIHLRDCTIANVPAGIQGIETHFRFSGFAAYAKPIAFDDRIGDAGGVGLPAPVLYGINPGYYDDTNTLIPFPYTGATQFKVAAAGAGGWNADDGIIAILTFEIIDQPNENFGESAVTFPMPLTFTDLVDAAAAQVTHTVVNGQLKINAIPFGYPARPYIYVDPATKTGTMGEIFTVSVMINTAAFWDVAGYDVTLTYDPTLLAVVGYAEGNFLTQHGEATFGWFDDTVAGEVWAVFVKLSNPTESSGVDSLFTVDFEVIFETTVYPPPTAPIGLADTDLASWAHPERSMSPWENKITGVQLPYNPDPVPPADPWTHYTIGGTYTAPLKFLGPDIDVYTQYPYPYGGQGPDEHSDAFAPQMLVCLFAKVTYNGDRVTNKLVVFEIHNALDEKITILQNYSDINGIAMACFRIPQTDLIPGGEDPAIFGWWWVIATVEIDEVVVDDTLTFQVGWLVKVDSVVAVGDPYRKYIDPMYFDVTVSSIFEQGLGALLTVDPFDEQNYPIGEAYTWVWVQATRVAGDPHGTIPFVDTWTFGPMPIPTWCRVGVGTVRAVALTDWPRFGGTAYCPSMSDLFGITKD
jgi:hypothetical protein